MQSFEASYNPSITTQHNSGNNDIQYLNIPSTNQTEQEKTIITERNQNQQASPFLHPINISPIISHRLTPFL